MIISSPIHSIINAKESEDDFSGEMSFMNNKVKFAIYKAWIAVVSFFERIGAAIKSLPDRVRNSKSFTQILINTTKIALFTACLMKKLTHRDKLSNGIPNLGNTCYMGACVQAIAGNKALEKMFRDSKCDKPLKTNLLNLIDAIKNPDAKGGGYALFNEGVCKGSCRKWLAER